MAEVTIAVGGYRYGDGAFGALAAAIARAKAGDPLAPVSVVVERPTLGLATRRRLAAAPGGVASVRFCTWGQLGLELAGDWVAARGAEGRRPITAAAELEAVRAALSGGDPGRLVAAREQAGAQRAVARTLRELASVPDAALDALGRQSDRAREVVAVLRTARRRLGGCYDTAELLCAATDAVRRSAARAAQTVGALVVYLPSALGPAEQALLGALARSLPAEVVVGLTGDDAADERPRALIAALRGPDRRAAGHQVTSAGDEPQEAKGRGEGAGRHAPWRDADGRDATLRVWSLPTADAEVLTALRFLLRRHAEGVPLERMALLHAGAGPHPRLAQDLLALAGIPAHGPSARLLASTVPGRVLLGALALGEHDWRRDDVVSWLASGPILHDGRVVPAADWDVLSCEAGVVAGLSQWEGRLAQLAASLRATSAAAGRSRGADAQADDAQADDAWEVEGTETARAAPTGRSGTGRRPPWALERDAGRCDELRAFLSTLSRTLAEQPGTWEGWAAWADRFLTELLGAASRHAGWPTEEIAALDDVRSSIGALGALDGVKGPRPSLADFRTAVFAELDVPAPSTERFGRGVLAGRVHDAVGLDLDIVWVVGMNDGVFPARPADDVLLPDRERELAGVEVPLRGVSGADGRRELFAAVAGASQVVLSYPRGDQRLGRELRPARLVLEALEHLAGDGRRLYPRDVRAGLPAASEGLRHAFGLVASFPAAVRGVQAPGEPLSEADWKLRSLVRWRTARDRLDGHFLCDPTTGDPRLVLALDARAARRGRRFSRFDGLVEGLGVPSPASGEVMSPTRLEEYARCPRRYLFSHLLDVAVRERPEAVVRLSPLERGALVHSVLERLVREDIGGGREDAAEWAERRVGQLAARAFADLEARGVTGHPVLWALDRSRILEDLLQLVRQDAAYRLRTRARPLAVERSFGFGGEPEVRVPLGTASGTEAASTVRFRGRVDRIDKLEGSPGGDALAVIDYKSGRPRAQASEDDPLERGMRLQLPIYALAARAIAGGDPAAPVRAGYWYVGSRPAPTWVELTGEVHARLAGVLETTIGGIEAGLFPANPGWSDEPGRREHCTYCAFDTMCSPRRGEEWDSKRGDSRLAPYVKLAEPPA